MAKKKTTKPIMNRLLSALADSEADGTQYVYLTRKDVTDAVKRITDLLVELSDAHTKLHDMKRK